MANNEAFSTSISNSTNGFSKANGNRDRESISMKRNFWQRRSKMEKILLACTVVLLLLVIILLAISMVHIHKTEDENFPLKSEAERKARRYYKSCMNKTRIEELGAEPLLDLLNKTGGWTVSGGFNINDWNFQRILEIQHNQYGAPSFFSWTVHPDLKNSSQNTIALYEPHLTLYTRNYYLNDTKDDKILDACLSYMTKVGVLLGGEENATNLQMRDILDFETKLAEIILPDEEKLDHNKIYEKMTVAELQEVVPFIHWTHYFNSAFKSVNRRISSSEEVVIFAREYLEKLSQLVTEYLYNPQGRLTLVNYAAWILVNSKIGSLSKPFQDASNILNVAMVGSKDKDVRWETCVSAVDGGIPFALSAMFIRETFNGESKPMAENMIDDIKKAFKENFFRMDWMDSETRELAVEKVDSLQEMIGFPEFILDPDQLDKEYEELEFSEREYFNNNLKVLQYDSRKEWKKLDLPSNRSEWMMSATTTNAYYSPSLNHFVISAGYLQPPFYDVNYPKSINFGAMGSVMGHEITHAFDNSGRLYDKNGNLNQWWKNSTAQNFEKRAQCFVDQYSSYEVLGAKLNGKLTLGENLADCGGLKVAYQQLSTAVHGATPSDEQTFRVIGPMSNSEDFAKEFNCPSKSRMNPENKCEVW
ncbi:endothelin-converting enzyme homolog [Nephila pilipes]|uniref:Endothelin-converting enzyme homolog n=1 Tax=Nephila pilipes TaxID=299642 RepID=A0A8X6QTA3_NEPPI|nr:endothelin-converting enzyme homolog [Nephila pilipes]